MGAFYFAAGALTTPALMSIQTSPQWGWLLVLAACSLTAGAAIEWARRGG